MENFKPLTILFAPTYGNELISCCNGLVDELQERGHKIVFSVDISSKESVNKDGFIEGGHGLPSIRKNYFENLSNYSSIEIVKNFSLNYLKQMFEENKTKESYYKELIERIKPDIIITDSIICSPVLTNCGIPWVWLNFGAPNLYLNDRRLPPAWSGMSHFKLILKV
jgi:UDP:flavonoid glycosyltransferase YjiC (YdhE family)